MILYCFLVTMVVAAIALIPTVTGYSSTFSRLNSDPEATMDKYEEYWDQGTIRTVTETKTEYVNGQIVGSITIPRLDIYEYPLYYGENEINNNWQITTGGYDGNWGMCYDAKPMCAGAHNYQIFQNLKDMKLGDKIIVENDLDIYVYEVIGSTIFKANVSTWRNVTIDEAEDYSLLLVTCYPFDVADTSDRYIVYTQLINGTILERATQAK